MRALQFAFNHSLKAAVLGGGHHVVGVQLLPGGVTIDTSTMRNVTVDPDSDTAYVQSGPLLLLMLSVLIMLLLLFSLLLLSLRLLLPPPCAAHFFPLSVATCLLVVSVLTLNNPLASHFVQV